MDRERGSFPVQLMCRVLGVSRSGYYKSRLGVPALRDGKRAETLAEIRVVFEASRRTYGSPRIQRELRSRGRAHSRRFIGMLMKRASLRACAGRRRRPKNLLPARHTLIGNVLSRRFTVAQPNRVWAADFTFVHTAQGWLYLAVVLDLASRRVVGWAMGQTPDVALVVRALEMAVLQRRPAPGLLHHSDRGLQYSNNGYLDRLAQQGMEPSFSRIGDCWDNAVVESFFHTLKVERVNNRPTYKTRDEAKADLFDYIEVWYNRQRRHSTIGYVSPADYEARL
jgi:putative transposase